MTDEDVVKLVTKGDINKFAILVERYEKRLMGYIRHLINQSEEEMEDVVAEVFIDSYRNLRGFDTEKKFSSWIFRIAHNKAIDYFRSKKKTVILSDEAEELTWNEEKLIEDLEIEKEERKRVTMAVEELEVKYREVVLLYYYEEKSYEEISDILHINTNQVGVLLFRAKEKLKKSLKSKV